MCFIFKHFTEAVGCFASRLTAWELQEIVKYPQIWYVGHEAVRKINGDKTNPLNSAFDDENGNYIKGEFRVFMSFLCSVQIQYH